MAKLPDRLTFVDVETTGLGDADRIVSFAAVMLNTESLRLGCLDVDYEHYLFNPGMPCHPRSREVHGYSDAFLAEQDLFEDWAGRVADICGEGQVWAHNAEFDQGFVRRELKRVGIDPGRKKFRCSLDLYRQHHFGSGRLERILDEEIGIGHKFTAHNALSDAWGAMMVYLWIKGVDVTALPGPPEEGLEAGAVPVGRDVPASPVSVPELEYSSMRVDMVFDGVYGPVGLCRALMDGNSPHETKVLASVAEEAARARGYVLVPGLIEDVVARFAALEGRDVDFGRVTSGIRAHQAYREGVGRWASRFLSADHCDIARRLAVVESVASTLRADRMPA